MWSELFLLNKDALLHEMDAFQKEFSAFRALLEAEDSEGMKEKMRQSTAKRMKFDKPKGTPVS
jgi:prephenate dehydrogenase